MVRRRVLQAGKGRRYCTLAGKSSGTGQGKRLNFHSLPFVFSAL
jgi:hypothetical protein